MTHLRCSTLSRKVFFSSTPSALALIRSPFPEIREIPSSSASLSDGALSGLTQVPHPMGGYHQPAQSAAFYPAPARSSQFLWQSHHLHNTVRTRSITCPVLSDILKYSHKQKFYLKSAESFRPFPVPVPDKFLCRNAHCRRFLPAV